MSRLEDRLRGAFHADAQTVKPDSIPAFTGAPSRPAAGRARLLMPVAAALATAAVAAGVWVTSSLPSGRAPHHVSAPPSGHPLLRPIPVPPLSVTTTPPVPLRPPVLGEDGRQPPRAVPASAPAPGVPRFFVTDEPANVPDAIRLVVRDTGTGKITGTIAPPRGTYFGSVAATAGNRTFLAVVLPSGGDPCVQAQQLYQFQLNSSGQPGPLVALHVAIPGNFDGVDTLAITPDGRTIAYETHLCDQSGEYGVIDLATRRVRVWSSSGIWDPAYDLSLSADGRLLVFTAGGQARILNTGAAAGSIERRSQILSRNSGWVALAGDGRNLYGCTVSPAPGPAFQKGRVTYFSQAIGSTQQHVIASWPGLPSPQCMASLDPSGPYMLVQYPTAHQNADGWVRPVILDLQSGRTTTIQAPAYYGPLTVAW